MRKTHIALVIVSLFVVSLIGIIVYSNTEFIRLQPDRESVVKLIKEGSITVQSNGCIMLPVELRRISDSGECFIVEFHGKTAIYFYAYRGILESSKGYLYVTDELLYSDYIDTSKYVSQRDFTDIVEMQKNWYSCSTN